MQQHYYNWKNLFWFCPCIRIVYSLVKDRNEFATPIEIDVDSGMLIINGNIDREKTHSYHLTVEANIDAVPRSAVDVNIYVQDVNDNAPQFATNTTQDLQSYTISIQSRWYNLEY